MQKEIAKKLGISESALSRELRRNGIDGRYRAETAHALATERRTSAAKYSKTDERHMPIIKKGLSLGWSPENISARMKVETPESAISHTTVYNRIATNKAQGGTLYKDLPRHGKRRCKGGKRKAGHSLIPNRVDITERPEVVELRSRLGDWEGDTVYGQDAHLVTLVDRKSRLTLIGKTDTKQADSVADSMIQLLKRVSSTNTILWITVVSLQLTRRWQKQLMPISILLNLMPVISGVRMRIPTESFDALGPRKCHWVI